MSGRTDVRTDVRGVRMGGLTVGTIGGQTGGKKNGKTEQRATDVCDGGTGDGRTIRRREALWSLKEAED